MSDWIASEWFVLVYAVVLFTCLMLAARWQPKGSPTAFDDQVSSRRKVHRTRD